ncbi:MAG TPA: class I SAM-dependent DNA methyltransferase [Fibrobacteria bacterium]|nr:class I SAM-dependent DNA methyltransferase [Fibrobacteria bacterium]
MITKELKSLQDTLWRTADQLRSNSPLKSSEYAVPVLGLIFLKFADSKYAAHEAEIQAEYKRLKGSRRERGIYEIAISKCGFYLPHDARYGYLLDLPEKEDLAQAIKHAMEQIEEFKPDLQGVLPKDEYFQLNRKKTGNREIIDNAMLAGLLKSFSNIPSDAAGDLFGLIYEYFLGKFALAEGQGGGQFFTPRSVVRLMVEVIRPHDGTVFDPACGSGGMFVQSAQFVEARRTANPDASLYVYGTEMTMETVKLAKMNLAVNGLRGEVVQANAYYDDPYESFGKFDYVLANPPFNVDEVLLAKVEKDARFNTYGVPRNKTDAKAKDKGAVTVPNANYLWINLFATSLKPQGRAALVMPNSASDARHSEADIRKTLVDKGLISGMLTLPSNMFYTVTLPATLWFFDKAKKDDKILFIDARNVFTQIDRAHREFSEEQLQNLTLIQRLREGNRQAFVSRVDHYFEQGFASLAENRPDLEAVTARLAAFLTENGISDIPKPKPVLAHADRLLSKQATQRERLDLEAVDKTNAAQRKLSETVAPFFEELHALLKAYDKLVRQVEKDQGRSRDLKGLKAELETLHADARAAEYFFGHIRWLQERFPTATYEDVTGLCKLASLADVREQEYSLNPGRYVGVVIEEDGKTEEEFLAEMLSLNEELEALNKEARKLETVIGKNIRLIAGDE